MAVIDPSKIDWRNYEEFSSEKSKNEAWNYTKRYRIREDIRKQIPKDSRKRIEGLKYDEIWKCNYCGEIRAGNVGRARSHLAGIKDQGSSPCRKVDPEVRKKFAPALERKDDVDTRENKRRNASKSSGLNPIAEGNPSNATLLVATNGSGEVSPGSAEMGGWSSANLQGLTEHLHDNAWRITTSGLRDSQLNSVGEGGNISNTARQEQPSGEISMVASPLGLRSCRLPIFEQIVILGSGATSGQGADADSAIGLGSTALNPNGEAGSNHSNFTGQQAFLNIVNMEPTIMGMSPQRSNSGEVWGSGFTDVEAGDFDMARLEDVEAGGSDFTSQRVQGSTGLICDVVGQTRTPRLGNSQPSAVEGGGNISNLPQLEQPFGIVSMANAPTSMLSQPSIFGGMAGSSAACAQRADAGELFPLGGMAGSSAACAQRADTGSATRSGSSPLHPNGEAGINDSSSLAHQPPPPSTASIEMPGMGVSSQWSNMLQGSGMAVPEDAGAGCSNSTSPGFGNSPNISHPACQPQIPGIAMAAPNSLGNIANGPVGPRSPEAGRSERNIRTTPPSDWQQQINGATAYANDTRTEEDINTEGIFGPTGNSPLNTNRETGSDSNGLTHLPPPLNTGSTAMTNMEMSSQRLNFCEISRSGIAGTEDSRAGNLNSAFRLEGGGGEKEERIRRWNRVTMKLVKEYYKRYSALQERKLMVETQVCHFNWINEGRKHINKWLEREREVSKRSIDLFKILNDATSIGSTMQPVQMIQDLTKEVEDLIEESRTFDALAVNRVMDFMKCRLHRSMKDHLRVALPVLLA